MNKQKILILTSSPRLKGNSTALAEQLEAGAKQSGAEVKTFDLAKMDIHPCTACDACLTYDEVHCDTEDDMQQIYPELQAADTVVFASPIYWFTFNAQMKLCMDRMYAFENKRPHPMQGKKIAALFVYGDDDVIKSGVDNAIHTIRDAFRYTRSEIVDIIHASADKPGDILKNEAVMQEAFDLGVKLGKSS
jgi:multimeric flavodoxin WrbA